MMKGVFLGSILAIIFYNHGHALAQNYLKLREEVSEVKNQISGIVSPQVELISIVQAISKYPTVLGFLMANDFSEYKSDVIAYFSPYRDHPVIHMFDRLSIQPGMLNFMAPSSIMLQTDRSLYLREDIEIDDFVINRAGGRDSLDVFLNLLRDFATQSSFNELYNEHQAFYLKIVENTMQHLGPNNYISEIEGFYGKTQKSYNIVLVSLYRGVGFGNSLLYYGDQRELYNTMGPQMILSNMPFFGDEDYLKYMIRHEYSHPFVNPLTEKHWDYIKDYSNKFDAIPEVARKKVCGDWQDCINEFIIRAITTQFAYNESDEAGMLEYEKEKARGVSYMDPLLGKIRYYQSNRETYPALDAYYHSILDVFKVD